MAGPELRDGVGGLDRGRGGLVALVARRTAGPRRRLLERIGGEQAEPDGQPVGHRHLAEPAGGLPRDELEVRGLAPDDGAERHEAGVAAGGRGGRGGDRQLIGAGHPHHVHGVARDAGLGATGERALQQAAGDRLVVAADDDRHPADRAKAAGDLGHWG